MYDILCNIQIHKEEWIASVAQWSEEENAESLFYEHFGVACAVIHSRFTTPEGFDELPFQNIVQKQGLGFCLWQWKLLHNDWLDIFRAFPGSDGPSGGSVCLQLTWGDIGEVQKSFILCLVSSCLIKLLWNTCWEDLNRLIYSQLLFIILVLMRFCFWVQEMCLCRKTLMLHCSFTQTQPKTVILKTIISSCFLFSWAFMTTCWPAILS